MAIRLEKGQRINLEKTGGAALRKFCVGCNWGAIVTRSRGLFGLGAKETRADVDLDLSCLILDEAGQIVDHIYSPDYRQEFLAAHDLPPGKLESADQALRHSGDDRKGDQQAGAGQDNEIITVDLDRVAPNVAQIFFFLNNVGPEDFSRIPYASIRMYEGSPDAPGEVFAAYDVAAEPRFAGQKALIMGKLYRRDGKWRFGAIGDPTPDKNICETIQRIHTHYSR